jgi:hypothetical protein
MYLGVFFMIHGAELFPWWRIFLVGFMIVGFGEIMCWRKELNGAE